MAALTIHDLDDAVVARLEARAEAHGRSLEVEIREILAEAARAFTPRRSPKELRALAEQVAEGTEDRPQTDSVDLLREDRDR